MRYQPTIYVDNDLYNKIHDGEVTLQCGQWIQLAWCAKPARWVGLTSSQKLWVVHYPVKMDRFISLSQGIERFQNNNK